MNEEINRNSAFWIIKKNFEDFCAFGVGVSLCLTFFHGTLNIWRSSNETNEEEYQIE